MVYGVRVFKVVQNDTKQKKTKTKTETLRSCRLHAKERQLINDMITRAITFAMISTHKSAHSPPNVNNITNTSTTK